MSLTLINFKPWARANRQQKCNAKLDHPNALANRPLVENVLSLHKNRLYSHGQVVWRVNVQNYVLGVRVNEVLCSWVLN